MKTSFVSLFLVFSNFTAYALSVTSGITPVVTRGNIANRQLEASTSGNAVAIWTESSFSTQIQAAYFSGTGWFTPITIATGAFPQVGVPTSGAALAVWLNTLNTGSTQIFASRFTPSTNSWSVATQLSSTGINSAPQIAVNSQGNALAVWIQNYPPSIQGATYNATTGTWSAATTIISGSVTSPQVTLDNSNNGIITWSGTAFGIEAVTVSVP